MNRCYDNDIKIVLSSAWDTIDAKKVLKEYNFNYLDSIIGRTSRNKLYRGEQILDYIREYNITNYVVLEDEIRDVCGSKCNAIPRSNVIEIDMTNGLSDKNAIDAIKKLNNIGDINKCKISVNKDIYKHYHSLGFRSNVLIECDDDLEKWDYFTLNVSTLTMIMERMKNELSNFRS